MLFLLAKNFGFLAKRSLTPILLHLVAPILPACRQAGARYIQNP